jgi:hypothetical protein
MKKILVVGYGSMDSMYREKLSLPLLGMGYNVDTLQDSKLTEEIGKQYDLIFAQKTNSNYNVLKALLDAGIPIAASPGYDNEIELPATLGMTLQEKIEYTYNNKFDFIDESSIVFSQFKYKSISPLKVSFTNYSSPRLEYLLSDKMAKSGIAIASTSLNQKNRVVISCFPRGGEDCFGNKFKANCVFYGCSRIETYKNIFEVLNGILDWCFGTVEISGDVVSSDNEPLSREVIFYPKKRHGVGYKTVSNESGKFTIQLPVGHEYFGVAFDEENGDKNAVIIDKITV